MNWKIVWKKCKEFIFPYAKRVRELEDVVGFWFHAYKVSKQEADNLRSENKDLQCRLEEISASFNALTEKYENLLACQEAGNVESNLPAAKSDFWDSSDTDLQFCLPPVLSVLLPPLRSAPPAQDKRLLLPSVPGKIPCSAKTREPP